MITNKKNYSDEEIISGIINEDNNILNYIYNKYYRIIRHFIISNSGSEEEARDVFQDALITLYRKVKYSDFKISCAFETLLYSIARIIWLNALRNRKLHNIEIEESLSSIDLEDVTEQIIENSMEYKLYQKHFNKLAKECQELLKLSYENITLDEITKRMGYISIGYTKIKKYKCKKHLLDQIRNSPEFKKLGFKNNK